MGKVQINPRDFTALVPDGPVNRQVQVRVFLDTDTGQLTGEPMLEHARVAAQNAAGDLPPAQRPVKRDDDEQGGGE